MIWFRKQNKTKLWSLAASPKVLHPSSPIWHNTVISCPQVSPCYERWLPVGRRHHPVLTPIHLVCLTAEHETWTLPGASGHFMSDGEDKPPVSFWPCLNKDTDRISLCSAVESHQHTSWTGRSRTVENNLLHSCSCHVGLASSWTVIYFGL